VHEVPVAAVTAPIHESGAFELGNQLTNLWRHQARWLLKCSVR
jgi:hypothetical protein